MILISVLILLGSTISLFSLAFIINDKKRGADISTKYSELESEVKSFQTQFSAKNLEIDVEFKGFKSEIENIIKDFNTLFVKNSENLENKVAEIKESALNNTLSENEISALKSELETLKNSYNEIIEKLNTPPSRRKNTKEKIIQLVQKDGEKELPKKKEFKSEIDEYIDKGLSQAEISEMTGKSVGEIEFIMGLRNMR